MAKRKVRVTEFKCDVCDQAQFVTNEDPDPPLGWQGTVFLVTATGGNAAEWFCCLSCDDPGKALHRALVREAGND